MSLFDWIRLFLCRSGGRSSAKGAAPTSAAESLLSHLRAHGAAGLDLSAADLEGANLDGLNLDGAKLGDYEHRHGARLARASLEGASLRGAILCFADLTGAKLRRADLTAADASYAALDGANLRWAQMADADLYQASLAGANLAQADLTRANLYLARLNGTQFTRSDLRPPLLQEDAEAYVRFLNVVAQRRGRSTDTPSPRLERIRDIYQTLKTNWRGTGRSDDASWAYVRERRAERDMHAPWRAADHFGSATTGSWLSRPLFYIKQTLSWALSWLANLTCGYGESPWRAIGAALVVLLIFPFFYWASRGIVAVHHGSPWDYLMYSISAFTTFGFDNYQAANWFAQLLTGIEALLGMGLFALVMFTLGNRISRL